MRTTNSFALLIFIAILGVGVALAYAMHGTSTNWESFWSVGGAFVVALVVACGIRVANQWDKAVVLRLGRFRAALILNRIGKGSCETHGKRSRI